MPVHLATISATSSSSTSSFNIAPSRCRSLRRCGHRVDLALDHGDVAVAQLRGALEVAVALGPLGVELGLLEPLLAVLDRDDRVLLGLPVRDHAVALLLQRLQLGLERVEPLLATTSSVSFASAARSISSWRMRRSTTSISNGIESISMRRRDAASSTRSIALSGSWRPVM